jgi:hypothetical protein
MFRFQVNTQLPHYGQNYIWKRLGKLFYFIIETKEHYFNFARKYQFNNFY